jgi:OOP family OmpA-OmpF porin
MKPSGTTFNSYLAQEYLALSTYEEKVEFDWQDSDKWAKKGLDAAGNKAVLPEVPDDKDWGGLPQAARGPLAAARQRLMAALDRGGRDKAPKAAARAQVMYDCWVEEEEEAWQKDRIAYCKGEFEKALAGSKASVPAPAWAAPAAAWPRSPTSSSTSTSATSWASCAESRGRCGHEFKSGRANITWPAIPTVWQLGYNQLPGATPCSRLVARGVPANIVTEQAFGEIARLSDPDGVKEARNRRVEITIR